MVSTVNQTFTEKEAAEYLKVKPNVIRGLRLRNQIEHHRIARGRVRYTMEGLLAYLERCKVPVVTDDE